MCTDDVKTDDMNIVVTLCFFLKAIHMFRV